jgi:DNA-binding transcriptional regulator YiaG
MNTPKHPEEQGPMENDTDAAAAPPGPQSIRQLRLRLGLTQEEFAHAIAVTVSTVNRWENGHANPSKLAWRAIQSLLKKRSAIGRERQPG